MASAPGCLGGREDPVLIEIALARRRRPDRDRGIRFAHERQVGIDIRMHRDGADAHGAAVRMIRRAISPRLAMRSEAITENPPRNGEGDRPQGGGGGPPRDKPQQCRQPRYRYREEPLPPVFATPAAPLVPKPDPSPHPAEADPRDYALRHRSRSQGVPQGRQNPQHKARPDIAGGISTRQGAGEVPATITFPAATFRVEANARALPS
jgi:hypothetical protein